MTVNDVLDLVNFHGLSPIGWVGAIIMSLMGGAAVLVVAAMIALPATRKANIPDKLAVTLGAVVFLAAATVAFLLAYADMKDSLRGANIDMLPSEALSEIYGVEIENVGGRERDLLLPDIAQIGYRATIDGEVRALTIETIDSEYRITYVDSEQLVEVSPR